MKVYTDYDTTAEYEKNGLFKSLFNKFYIPILNIIPASARGFVKSTHYSAQTVIEKATTHHAIEVLYNFGEPEKSKTFVQKFFYYIWFSTDNSKALRNRLRLVTKKLKEAIKEKIGRREKIYLLSIAAGSARAILDAVSITELEKVPIEVTFLDKNPEAHDYSKKLISERQYGSSCKFSWIVNTANNFPKYFENEKKPDIIEVVGLLDYFDKDAIRRLFESVFTNLGKDGVFITSNIVDNPERKFVTKLVGWDMLYKKPEDFYELALEVGFKDSDIEFIYEPLRIHFIMVAKKS